MRGNITAIWRLRDYGTAEWVGGSQDCDHVADASKTKVYGNPDFNVDRPSRNETKGRGYYYRDICEKCGARRVDAQIGLENTPDEYVSALVDVFDEVWRVLRDDGTLWLNLGDCYYGSGIGIPVGLKTKDLVGIRKDYLRNCFAKKKTLKKTRIVQIYVSIVSIIVTRVVCGHCAKKQTPRQWDFPRKDVMRNENQ